MINLLIFVVALCFVESAVFVVFYWLRSPWRATVMGKHLMAFGVTLMLLFGMNLWSIFITTIPVIVWLIGISLFAGMLGWRLQLMFKAQRNRVSK